MARQIKVDGTEHKTHHQALVELNFSGDVAISIGGRIFTVTRNELNRIEGLGVQPTSYYTHKKTGKIISIPGKHG
jgi:hypothetical protein